VIVPVMIPLIYYQQDVQPPYAVPALSIIVADGIPSRWQYSMPDKFSFEPFDSKSDARRRASSHPKKNGVHCAFTVKFSYRRTANINSVFSFWTCHTLGFSVEEPSNVVLIISLSSTKKSTQVFIETFASVRILKN